MYLAVQKIEISYSYDERGGEAAQTRARLPRGLTLPAREGEVFHDCRVHSWDRYERPTISVGGVPRATGCLRMGVRNLVQLAIAADRIAFVRDASAEVWRTYPILELPLGTWGRVIWNESRWDDEHAFLVELSVNAGLFADAPDANVFEGTPREQRDLRRDFLHNGYREQG